MTKYLFLLLFTCFLCLCACSRHTINCAEKTPDSNSYKVVDIKKENRWYFIYLERNDSLFKVVSYEPYEITTFKLYRKIEKNKRYNLHLNSYKKDLVVDGEYILRAEFSGGIKLDSNTTVCLEPENGIWDLYQADELVGLFYLKVIPK